MAIKCSWSWRWCYVPRSMNKKCIHGAKFFGSSPLFLPELLLGSWPQESKVWRQLENYVAVPVQVVLSEYTRPNKIRVVLPFNLNRCKLELLVDLHHHSGSTLSHGIISFCSAHFWWTTLLLFFFVLWGWVKQMLIPQRNISPLLQLEWDITECKIRNHHPSCNSCARNGSPGNQIAKGWEMWIRRTRGGFSRGSYILKFLVLWY